MNIYEEILDVCKCLGFFSCGDFFGSKWRTSESVCAVYACRDSFRLKPKGRLHYNLKWILYKILLTATIMTEINEEKIWNLVIKLKKNIFYTIWVIFYGFFRHVHG